MEFDEQPQEFNVDFGEVTRSGGGGGGAVNSVNGKTGDVVLDAEDVGALPISTTIPEKTSDIENDGADGTSTYVEADELATVATSGKYNDLSGKPSLASVATSGKYTDLTDTPTIPSTASDVGALPDSTKYGASISASGTTLTLEDQDGETLSTATTQDTTYSNFTGTDGQTAGASGLVPAPATTDAGKFLKADGTWDTAGGGGPTVVQTIGSSTTDVMSQKAVTDTIFANSDDSKIRIGNSNQIGSWGISIGSSAAQSSSAQRGTNVGGGSSVYATAGTAIGNNASVSNSNYAGAVALGAYAKPTAAGQVYIGSSQINYGYNTTNYRLLSGLYDGQSDHDAVTVGQINALIDAINTAAGTNISHIGS